MKRIATILLLTISLSLFGQDDFDDDILDDTVKTGFFLPFEIWTGKKVFDNSLYGQTNSFQNFDLNRPSTIIAIGWQGQFVVSRNYGWPGHLSLQFYLPENIEIISGELEKQEAKFGAYLFSMSLYGWDFTQKKKSLSMVFSTGMNLGQTRLTENAKARQKNNIIAPFISFSPRFFINRLSLGFIIMYDYDISNPNWKKALFVHSDQMKINKFRNSGLTTYFCLTYGPRE